MTNLKNPVYPDAYNNCHITTGHHAESDSLLKSNVPTLPGATMMCLAATLKPMGVVQRRIVSENIVPGQFVIFDHLTQFTDIFQATRRIAIKTCSEGVARHRFI